MVRHAKGPRGFRVVVSAQCHAGDMAGCPVGRCGMMLEETMDGLELVREAHELLREYDGSTVAAVAEIRAEERL